MRSLAETERSWEDGVPKGGRTGGDKERRAIAWRPFISQYCGSATRWGNESAKNRNGRMSGILSQQSASQNSRYNPYSRRVIDIFSCEKHTDDLGNKPKLTKRGQRNGTTAAIQDAGTEEAWDASR